MASLKVQRPRVITSAAGVISLLEESENSLKVHALERLNASVDQFWAEIAESLGEIERLYEDEKFSHRHLAALVASKVYYHLEEYGDAMRLALGAGDMFDIFQKSQYVDTIVAQCIDRYITQRRKADEKSGDAMDTDETAIDPRLERIVERMFDRCVEEGEYRQALGIALETRRLERVEAIVKKSPDTAGMLRYCLKHAQQVIPSKRFRTSVLELLVKIYRQMDVKQLQSEYSQLTLCLFLLEDTEGVVSVIKGLMGSGREEDALVAYQLAFDVAETDDQAFLKALLSHEALQLPKPAEAPAAGDAAPAAAAAGAATDAAAPAAAATAAPVEEDEATKKLRQLRSILSNEVSTDLALQFLVRANKTDLTILDTLKASVDQRNSVTHSGIVMAHALMQAGTTSDAFLRSNLEWLGKAVNWAKFSATASLGVVHRGHVKESKKVLAPYLPGAAAAGARSSFSEGGSLYALGLIHANNRQAPGATEAMQYLLEKLKGAQNNETLQHGACLGLGLVAMGTGDADEQLYEELKNVLFIDSAVAGEAAGYGLGLLMLGTNSERAIQELLAYAHDTQHEKIIRACAIALALIVFKREEEADTLIQQLSLDKDPILRYGGMFAIGLAYCGTSQNAAIKKLLHVSVSDVSDDVRRAAVMALGFVLCNNPEQVPRVVNLLTESYNPHVRYAAAMALGIACAGTALEEAVALLMPMCQDTTDFVRQAALLGLGLVLMNATEGMAPEGVKKAREACLKVAGSKYEDVMTRFGAILATGLMNAGGRNAMSSFYSKSGSLRQEAAAGFCLFAQLWYWFPLIHCVSLTLKPTGLIALTGELKMPSLFSVKCVGVEPSHFAYPAVLEKEKKEEKTKAATAVLSTTKKREAAIKKKEEKDKDAEMKPAEAAAKDGDVDMADASSAVPSATSLAPTAMEVESNVSTAAAAGASGEKKEGEKEGEKKEKKKKIREEELKNPCRVLPAQEKYIQHILSGDKARYVPVFPVRKSGIVVLRDTKPGEPETYIAAEKEKDGKKEETKKEEKEPEAPEAFEWSG